MVAPLHSAQQKMRGRGWAAAFLVATAIFAGACDLGGGTTNPTARISPESSPSSATGNPATSSPPASSPSATAAPSASGLAVSSLPVHNGEVGVGYLAVNFQATGGTGPYTWSVSAGALPQGLTLSAGGVLTGNNTTAGKFNFTAQVTDSTAATAIGSANMTVFPPLTVSQPCAQVCYVGMGCATCGRFGSVSGGAGPYHYKLAGGTVPSGMTLNGLALQGPFPLPVFTGPVDVIVAGPPITKLVYSLSASVTDDFGVTKTVGANFWEFFPLHILCTQTSPCSCSGTPSCNAMAAYEFGAPSDNVTVQVTQVCDVNGANCIVGTAGLPAVWSVTSKAGLINVSLDPNNGFFGQVTIDLVDHGACVAPGFAVSSPQVLTISWPGP
jgi:putative Ig domain-containing protein